MSFDLTSIEFSANRRISPCIATFRKAFTVFAIFEKLKTNELMEAPSLFPQELQNSDW